MIGRTLAQYSIESRLGAGGMGEVYRARDTRLGRSVAVKVLPGAFAQDPDRISRFQREAKLLASLNHANIAALHGLEEFEATHFLVMELVEGETLAERIARGPLPAEEALRIAHQIAEALESAHESGVIHRDLKPANVKITPEGKVKVLDFGLAKAMESSPANSALSNSPTISMAATNAGVILGTAAYMSPEQAKGLNADARSDIFSFGCVLYEMLTGRQPFQGDTVAEILAGVIAREPDLSSLPANLTPRVIDMMRRCLEKNPKRRWYAVADVRVELETILADPRGLLHTERLVVRQPLWKSAIPVMLGVAIGAGVVGIAAWMLQPTSPPATVTRFAFTLPEDQRFTNAGRHAIAISPDGARFVYVANNRIYLRSMGQLESTFIQGTETTGPGVNVMNPVFSPDGQSIAFWSATDQTIKRISVSGGTPVTICPAAPPFGMSWGPGDEIVFGQGAGGIMRVSANGGRPESIVGSEDLGGVAHGPQILPGGEAVLFTLATTPGPAMWDRANIVVQPIGSGDRKTLIEGGTDARYLPTGHIVYALAGNLLAVPFDVGRLEVTGGPIPILERVAGARASAVSLISGASQFSVSETGSLVYIQAAVFIEGTPQRSISLVDRRGTVRSTGLPPGGYGTARISRDGKKLALSTDDGTEGIIWIYDLSGASSMRRLTFGGRNYLPVWSEDNERIVFSSTREGDTAIFVQRADGTGAAERLTKPEAGVIHLPDTWSPVNDTFSFVVGSGGDMDVWTHSIQEKKSAALIVTSASVQGNSAFSPDGRWVAYQSNEIGTSGRSEIYVQPYPTTGAKFQITRDGGVAPLWSADGKELFYVNAGRLFSVNIQTQPAFTFSNPTLLPISGFLQPEGVSARQYDVLPNGQFLMIFPVDNPSADSTASLQIQVVLNWFEELKQRLGSR